MVEADIEIGFRLVEMLESWSGEKSGLEGAMEAAYAGALARVHRLPLPEQENFAPLIGELRRAMNLAAPPSSAAG